MGRRHKMSRRSSERNFSSRAGFHPKNNIGSGFVMRGGIRL